LIILNAFCGLYATIKSFIGFSFFNIFYFLGPIFQFLIVKHVHSLTNQYIIKIDHARSRAKEIFLGSRRSRRM